MSGRESSAFDWIGRIRAALQSADREARVKAIQELLVRARKDPAQHVDALEIFRGAIASETDPWSATRAAQGIELIGGIEAGREAWQSLLVSTRADMLASAAMSISNKAYAPLLLELLARRPEARVRICAVRTLGRMGDAAAFPALVSELADPAVRPHAIDALSELGEPLAIPQIEPLLSDRTDAWPEDNHGPMLRVCDIANMALLRLKRIEQSGPTASPDGAQGATQMTDTRSTAASQRSAQSAPAAVGLSSTPLSRAATWPPEAPHRRCLLAYVPLLAAAFEVIWVGMLIVGFLIVYGGIARTPAETHRLDVLAMIPAAAGLLIGGLVLWGGWAKRRVEWVCAVLGMLACCVPMFMFGWELTH
jgi:hypothetical protein